MKGISDMGRSLWPCVSGWLAVMTLMGWLFASCDNEETGVPASLPDGKYPLSMTAEINQLQTRAGGKDAWAGSEEIEVLLDGMLSPKRYVMNVSSNAVPKDAGNTIYWKNTTEARVTAWTPNIFDPNVDISDQSSGYVGFDLLYASAMGRYDQAVNLRFNHRMVKVEFTLAAGDGITEEEIEGANVTLFGDAKVYFSGGMVGTADQSDGEIKPYHDATTKKYEAVVVPQDMTGKPLLRIGIGNNIFTYTPETDAAGKLESGKRYAYIVTVKANGIDVQAVTGGVWSTGGEENVEVVSPIVYTADEVKAGDYIYLDGTTSDGGLRKRYADGRTPVIADPKPEPVDGKKVVGIVFWVPKDTDPTGRTTPASLTDDKIMAKDFPACTHGLAVSLEDVKSGLSVWQDPYESVQDFQNGVNFSPVDKADYVSIGVGNGATDNSNRILGYQNTKVLRAYNDYCKAASGKEAYVVRPVDALASFTSSNYRAPANSTGWFIPSPKELHMLCYKDVDDVWEQWGSTLSYYETKRIVDASLSAAGGIVLSDFYWSSSERVDYDDRVFDMKFAGGASMWFGGKEGGNWVRAVCAF